MEEGTREVPYLNSNPLHSYRWIAFINPNYYGFSSVAFFLLEDFDLCEGTELECYLSSGAFTLRMFNFDKINPYMHLAVSSVL